MKTLTYLEGLPYGAPGDTVDVSVMESSVSFTHLGTAEASRKRRDHRGQVNPWNCAVVIKDIRGVTTADVGRSGLFGWMSRSKGPNAHYLQRQKRLVIHAYHGGRSTDILLQGAGPDIDDLAKMMTDAARATPVIKQRDREATVWRD